MLSNVQQVNPNVSLSLLPLAGVRFSQGPSFKLRLFGGIGSGIELNQFGNERQYSGLENEFESLSLRHNPWLNIYFTDI